MAEKKTIYVCQNCGQKHPKWQGRCDGCGEWNTIIEEIVERIGTRLTGASGAKPIPLSTADSQTSERISTGFKEFDRVLGGGVIPGSVILVAGEPGIGKSTVLLQIALNLSAKGKKILFIAAEESIGQIKLRANRILQKGNDENIFLLSETSAEGSLNYAKNVDAIIVDSIQAMVSEDLGSAAGNVAQVRQCTAQFIQKAKKSLIPTFIIGHLTKAGAIAGPKVIEHAVDAVLTLEGDRQNELRLLRSIKNRFGATGEIGVFSMNEGGFVEVENPSVAFLGHHDSPVPGSIVYAGMEGMRPLFVEIQALVAPSAYGVPQRISQGIDPRRIVLLSAILERRGGVPLSKQDLFLNVVGGVTLTERSADLAVLLAIFSSFRDLPARDSLVVLGEIGLTGELRRAPRTPQRLKEAARLGFRKAIVPQTGESLAKIGGIEILPVRDIFGAFRVAFEKK